MDFFDLRDVGGHFDTNGLKAFAATCSTHPFEVIGLHIDEGLKTKFRDVLLKTEGAINLEITECESVENKVRELEQFYSRKLFNIDRREETFSYLSVHPDSVYLVVLCEKKNGVQTLVENLLEHHKNPNFHCVASCSVEANRLELDEKCDSFILLIDHVRFWFKLRPSSIF